MPQQRGALLPHPVLNNSVSSALPKQTVDVPVLVEQEPALLMPAQTTVAKRRVNECAG